MPIVCCLLELHIPYSQSLKEKRSVIRRTSDRLRNRFNFSISEIGHQESWQRGMLGAVSIGPDRVRLEQLAHDLVSESEKLLEGALVRYEIDFFDI